MKRIVMKGAFALVIVIVLISGVEGFAKSSEKPVAIKGDWGVYVDSKSKDCWIASTPQNVRNTRNGSVVSVKRGDIFLYATFHANSGGNPEIAFTGGYPFKRNLVISLTVDGKDRFDMITDGEWSWPRDRKGDLRIVSAFKKGGQAVLNAESSRGTKTKDTFSLNGFTAALAEAKKRCKK